MDVHLTHTYTHMQKGETCLHKACKGISNIKLIRYLCEDLCEDMCKDLRNELAGAADIGLMAETSGVSFEAQEAICESKCEELCQGMREADLLEAVCEVRGVHTFSSNLFVCM